MSFPVRRLSEEKRPALRQTFQCSMCGGMATTVATELKQEFDSGGMWTETIRCDECNMVLVLKTPAVTWPQGSEFTITQSNPTERMIFKITQAAPPDILCSSCGEVLEKADDCYRCKCGREVRP